jgi:cyanophycin synthetase
VRRGGRAVVVEQGVNGEMLTLYDNGKHIPLLWAHLIPATFEGHARFNIPNALAAAAIAYGLGATVETIRLGLQTFATTFYQAPGRLNVFEEYPFRVIMDYAHNPPAMREMAELVRSLDVRGRRIAVLGAPGDRRDSDIRQYGELAARAFDHLILKEDWDRRGRAPGEVPELLRQAALACDKRSEDVEILLNEFDAVRHALDMAQPGDLLVVFADDVTGTWKLITKYRQPEVYQRWLAETGQPVPA